MRQSFETSQLEVCRRLDQISLQLAGIARRVAHAHPPEAPANASALAVLAERIYRQRRQREAAFGPELFADPVWDILLDLFVHRSKGVRPQVSSVCIGAATPATTALRWIDELERRGLIEREKDPNDRRRHLLSISDEGYSKMEELLGRAAETLSKVLVRT